MDTCLNVCFTCSICPERPGGGCLHKCYSGHNGCKVLDKSPIVSCKPKKLLNFLCCTECWPLCYFPHFGWVSCCSVFRYNMPQILDLLLEKTTLWWLLCPLVQALGISKYDLQAIKIFFFFSSTIKCFTLYSIQSIDNNCN